MADDPRTASEVARDAESFDEYVRSQMVRSAHSKEDEIGLSDGDVDDAWAAALYEAYTADMGDR